MPAVWTQVSSSPQLFGETVQISEQVLPVQLGNARIADDEDFAAMWGDLGPVYGKQWVDWPTYQPVKGGLFRKGRGINQVAEVVESLPCRVDTRARGCASLALCGGRRGDGRHPSPDPIRTPGRSALRRETSMQSQNRESLKAELVEKLASFRPSAASASTAAAAAL